MQIWKTTSLLAILMNLSIMSVDSFDWLLIIGISDFFNNWMTIFSTSSWGSVLFCFFAKLMIDITKWLIFSCVLKNSISPLFIALLNSVSLGIICSRYG